MARLTRSTFGMTAAVVAISPVADARAGQPVSVAANRLYERGGRTVVPIVCHRATCRGSVTVAGRRRAFSLVRGDGLPLTFSVSRRQTRVRLTLRRGPAREPRTLPLLHRPDPYRCGYGRLATVLVSRPGVRILDVSLGGSLELSDRAMACIAGRPLTLANGTVVEDFVVTDGGAVAATQHDPCAPVASVRLVDASGERLVDRAPGIDLTSLEVNGDTVSWLRDGQRQSVLARGTARQAEDILPYAICP